MSTAPHLQTLIRKHQDLHAQITKAEATPGVRDLELQDLKKRKLKLKDQIERHRQKIA